MKVIDLAELSIGDEVIAGHGYQCKVVAIEGTKITTSYYPLSNFTDTFDITERPVILIKKATNED